MSEFKEKYHGNSEFHAKELVRYRKRYQEKREKLGLSQRKTHGLSKTSTWWTWHFMKQRVLNPSNKDHHLYKDRTIDPRWVKFENFYKDMGERPRDLTLERIDNLKGYSPDNCKWDTRLNQARNRHTCNQYTKGGVSHV